MKKSFARVALLALAILGLTEATVRGLGMIDFPVYDVDSEIGYVAKENQAGNFLNRNDWYFNDKGMPLRRNWDHDKHKNILLIGNSIVMGGNPFRQQDKLTQRLQEKLGEPPVVWPIANGGWTEVNEMVYLDRHPEVVAAADYVAWEFGAGGLSRATPWAGEYVFPSHRPIYATWYVLRRYVLPNLTAFFRGSELPVTGEPDAKNLQSFDRHMQALAAATHRSHPGIIWLFPSAEQLVEARNHREWLPERAQISRIAAENGLRIVDISTFGEWDRGLYRADGVHPTVEGNAVLASILSSEIARDLK